MLDVTPRARPATSSTARSRVGRREWELVGLPGGIQVFVLNVPIIGLVLPGVRALALGRRSGRALSGALVAAGAFAVVFHPGHLLDGDEAFRTPVSIGLLATTAGLSLRQVDLLRRARSQGRCR